nr:hypothetical protein [Pseudomonadota bacterium]
LDESGLRQRRAAVLRADLAEAEGDPEAAREALRAAATAEPDPEWRCQTCGTVQPAWSPVCPACGTAASLAWIVPSAAAPGPRLIEAQEIEALP